jgi:hypothetical protein
MSIYPEGNESGIVFIGMVHSKSPSLHTILEESANEGDTTSSGGGNSGFPISRGCNVVTPIVLVTTTAPPKGTLVPLTILMVVALFFPQLTKHAQNL